MQQPTIENVPENQKEIIALVCKESCRRIELKRTPARQLFLQDFLAIHSLFRTTYPDWQPEDIFEKYTVPRNQYVYRLFSDKKLIATRQIFIVDNKNSGPAWASDIAGAMTTGRFAIGSRALVHPDFRSSGIGTLLFNMSNHDIFSNRKLTMILGSSTSIGAISLHLRLGAKIWANDIDNLPCRNNSRQKAEILDQLLKSHGLRKMCLQHPLRYIYCRHVLPDGLEKRLWSNQVGRGSVTRADNNLPAVPLTGLPVNNYPAKPVQ